MVYLTYPAIIEGSMSARTGSSMPHDVASTLMAGCSVGKYHVRGYDDYDNPKSILPNEQFCADHFDWIEDFRANQLADTRC